MTATLRWLLAGSALSLLSGCAVVAVTSAAVSVTAGVVGLAADAAVGTVRIAGKGIGKAADAMMDDDVPADNSGIYIKENITSAP
ncbi:hypothetical protein N0K08_05465 [Acidovorax sp. Be4]|uniref:Lipoprotein n=1 Tax=Acidovorax bellezanensis TaxID=2976702 RepID=A0ABT2PHY8_9BURK|nr:hypothetical protein [Acidovorax sp. Be4]MCT9810070.1 hypothetical protein [Acidovorax sp. Be4]